MLKGYITIAFIFAFGRLSLSNNNECDYICDKSGCKMPTKKSESNISSMKFCSSNDIPNDANFSIIDYKNETTEFPVFLQINFKPPKKECKCGITLLANEGVTEKKCMHYNFQNLYGIETHTRATICFLSIDNEYQNVTGISLPYIYTACYSVQFFCGKSVKMMKSNKFLRTNYKRTEVAKPAFECTYEIVPDIISNKRQVVLEMSFSVSIVTAVNIYLGSVYSADGQEICFINKQDLRNGFQQLHILDNYIENNNSNMTLFKNGKYTRDWKFQIDGSYIEQYCFIISLYHDIRCKENTLWKPPTKKCSWYQSCQNVTTSRHVGFKATTDIDTISNFYLPIIIITLTILAIVGFMYLIYIIHTCTLQQSKFYINICNGNIIKTNQTKCNRRNVFSLNENKLKMENNDINIVNTDVILLYPKGPESFMTWMADFRGIISRVCGCVVHDWYDGTKWNSVAEVGASDWFAQMLHNQSRVLWVDTPAMRSLIRQRFRNDSFLKNSEEYSFAKIGDFRDAVFPTIFNLSKRNMEHSELYQSKHFVVRLKGFDHAEKDHDPFVELCPQKIYCIPQDLNILCSDLSVLDFDIITMLTKQEEEAIKTDLHHVKFDFCK